MLQLNLRLWLKGAFHKFNKLIYHHAPIGSMFYSVKYSQINPATPKNK